MEDRPDHMCASPPQLQFPLGYLMFIGLVLDSLSNRDTTRHTNIGNHTTDLYILIAFSPCECLHEILIDATQFKLNSSCINSPTFFLLEDTLNNTQIAPVFCVGIIGSEVKLVNNRAAWSTG